MTVVFSAEQPAFRRKVALKVAPLAGILLLPGFYAEFRGALEASKALSHPNILALHDFRLLETIACTVVEHVDGESLARHLARASEPMPFWRIKDIGCKVTEALAYAHTRGTVHCRLCPRNVMIERDQGRVLVADFGIPHVGAGPDATAAKALFLDARYLSPEECMGERSSPRSDQYALGAMLYEMVTGRPPFTGRTGFTIMRQQCEASVPSITELRPDCPPEVEATILKLLRKSADERYFTTGEVLNELREWPVPECPAGSTCAALASFERCLASGNVFLHFYERLCKDPELARYFKQTNMDRLLEMIQNGVRSLLESGTGDERARRDLERVAASHRHMSIDANLLQRFTDTLVAVVLEHDEDAAEPEERERLRRKWQKTIEPGLQPFLHAAAEG
jgi:serine/threonine protein kinase